MSIADLHLDRAMHRGAFDSWNQYKATGLRVTDEEVFAWFRKLHAGEFAPPPECHTFGLTTIKPKQTRYCCSRRYQMFWYCFMTEGIELSMPAA